ncbi:Integrator complex subunit [Ooceraea biroi]|uniref:Integrator complex subunit n=1 Tax=Ooceraea biroi TaxID=2015173 RepID=A0A026VTR8_OOCBI|nr:Integrator complex subunit [Ooceraea biroi]
MEVLNHPALDNVLKKVTATEKERISHYLLYLANTANIEGFASRVLNSPSFSSLFNETELIILRNAVAPDEVDLPDLLLHNDWGIPSVPYIRECKTNYRDKKLRDLFSLYFTESERIEVFELKQKLIESHDCHVIRETLIHLEGKHRTKPLWQINNCWELPIPLDFLQDYSYILLAKSWELVTAKNFCGAVKLLKVDSELEEHIKSGGPLIFKLCKFVSWECLLVEIWKCIHTWPATMSVCDLQSMIARSKQCLGALQVSDQLIPRREIVEYCTVFLLHMAEWDYLTSMEKRWSYTEFAAAISSVCQDIVKYKGTRKFPREAWDMGMYTSSSERTLSE